MRKWFRRFFSSGFFIPFILLLPYVCTIILNGADKALLLYSPGEEKLVPLLLMVQLKGDYEQEAVNAQAVIARSTLYRCLEAGESEGKILEKIGKILTWEKAGSEITSEKSEENSGEISDGKWGETKYLCENGRLSGNLAALWKFLGMSARLQRYEEAAEKTAYQVLTYKGELKLVPYHEISSGTTRDGEEVFHSEEYAYLKAVDSSQDKDSPDYVNSTYVSVTQLPAKLVIKKRDSAGYVTALTADGNWLEGETFRQGMHLASADFSMQRVGNVVRFLCKGKGHGLGFSQYGGNEMAKNGSSWEEILETYFPEMEISTVHRR